MIQELVRENLVKIWTHLGITGQYSLNQVPSRIRDVDMLWEGVVVKTNSFVGGFDVGRFEGRLANDQSIDDNTQRPDVYLVGVTALTFEHLWRDVVGCTANSSLFLAIEVQFRRQSKVAKFYLHLVVQKQVSEFQVAMNDPVGVQVLESLDDLHGVALHFQLVQTLSSFEQFVHGLVLAKFQQDVNVLGILEEVLELTNMEVLDAAVDLDLAHQLLLGSTFGQARLLNDF